MVVSILQPTAAAAVDVVGRASEDRLLALLVAVAQEGELGVVEHLTSDLGDHVVGLGASGWCRPPERLRRWPVPPLLGDPLVLLHLVDHLLRRSSTDLGPRAGVVERRVADQNREGGGLLDLMSLSGLAKNSSAAVLTP
jgi:hypothetical protein